MNKHLKTVCLVLLTILIILSPSFASTKKSPIKRPPVKKSIAAKGTEWAAKVNGDIVSMDWYNRAFDASKKQISKQVSTESDEYIDLLKNTRKAILEQIIEAIILLQWADREGIDVKDKEIKAKIKSLKKTFPSTKEFYKSLADQGMSAEDLERDLKKQIIIERLISQRAKSLAVSDEEMKAFYDKNIDMYQQKKRSHLMQEEFKDLEAAKKEKSALSKNKEDFDGEDLGFVEPGQLPVNDDSKVFQLKEGDISDITSGEAAFYIFRVVKVSPSKQTEFKDVKENILKFLLQEKARTQYLKDLQEEKANAKIILNEKLEQYF